MLKDEVDCVEKVSVVGWKAVLNVDKTIMIMYKKNCGERPMLESDKAS